MTIVLAIAVLALVAALIYVVANSRSAQPEFSEERLAEFMASTGAQIQARAGEELRKNSEHILATGKQQRDLDR